MRESSRRKAMALAVYHPCFSAFLFPLGAPGDDPPCIRQRPFGIAGDWQGLPLRVFAQKRGLDCRSKWCGMSLDLGGCGYPRRLVDFSDDGVVGVDGDVLDGDLLLTRPAMAVEPFGQDREGALCLVGHLKITAPCIEIFRRLRPSPSIHVESRLMRHHHL